MSRRRWAIVTVALVLLPTAAAAQEAPAPSEPTTTTSTSTTAPPVAVPTAPLPDDGASEAAPEEAVVIPPSTAPPPVDARRVQAYVRGQLTDARREVARLERDRAAAVAEVQALEQRLADGAARTGALVSEDQAAVERLRSARSDMQDRAAQAFMRGSLSDLDKLLRADGPSDFLRRTELITSALDADHEAIDEYRAARRAVDGELRDLTADLQRAVDERTAAVAAVAWIDASLVDARQRVEVLQAGSAVAVAGFVFPVGEPHSFVDSFLAPRMTGTGFAHQHQGTDIMAPQGTPVVACERGVVVKLGTDTLGGTKLWIVGASGTRYYYAHLAGYEPGLAEGQVVDAGTLVGYVGTTGNARGGAAHLHFEIHPPGLPAVNPYPILRVIDGAD